MKRAFFALAGLTLWISAGCRDFLPGNGAPSAEFPAATDRCTPKVEAAPSQIIARPAPGADPAAVAEAIAQAGARTHEAIPALGAVILRADGETAFETRDRLRHTPLFTRVEDDAVAGAAIIPNDPAFITQWHLRAMDAPGAWDTTTGSPQVPIAVVDSGVNAAHPELSSKVLPGWNFLTESTDTSDMLGHGTAVAGTAAAAFNNAMGGAGVAPLAPIMPLVVLNANNVAYYSDIARAIVYAADHGVRVVNVSLGAAVPSGLLQDAVDYAWSRGTVVFAAAMNAASSLPHFPAACDRVVAVGATAPGDRRATFSDFGEWLDMVAPGDLIYTTHAGGGYGWVAGTSFAAPAVAGVAALVLSRQPDLTPDQLVRQLQQTCDDLGAPGWDLYFGHGRVNARRAVTVAPAAIAPVDTTAPFAWVQSPT
ncbi:MAG: S8 family serine peptidase [Planctomycetes bacterium]|nr:S8 family serine peptidase [Planctomycetota bacterium]